MSNLLVVLAYADETKAMNNRVCPVCLPKYAVTGCVNEWTRVDDRTPGKFEPGLNSMRIAVGATLRQMEKFYHARTFVHGTGLTLNNLRREVVHCILVEVPDGADRDSFDLSRPVFAMQGSRLQIIRHEWYSDKEFEDAENFIVKMYEDYGRFATAGETTLDAVIERDSTAANDGELVRDVWNPENRDRRLLRRVVRTRRPVHTIDWTPAWYGDNRQRSDWEKLTGLRKGDINTEIRGLERREQAQGGGLSPEQAKRLDHLRSRLGTEIQHHGWNPYRRILRKDSVDLMLDDSERGRSEREFWFNSFLENIPGAVHDEISLKEGGPHYITPQWSWHLVTLKQPQMLQWVKEFAYKWGQQQESKERRGFLIQGCHTSQRLHDGKEKDISGVTQFLISLERHSIEQAERYRGLIASINPAPRGNYISLEAAQAKGVKDGKPVVRMGRKLAFDTLAASQNITEVRLYAHPETKSKTERQGVGKTYRFGKVDTPPNVPKREHYEGFKPFINNRGEGYVEVPEANTP